MEAQQVIDKILAEAESEAEQIKQKADGKVKAEQEKLGQQLAEYKEQTGVLAEKAGEEKKEHILSAARMQIAKELLAEKAAIIDEVFIQAQAKVQNLPDEDYKKMMSKLMLEAVETGDEEVIVDINEKRIDQGLIEQVNKQLSSRNKGNLKLADEKQNLVAGFILRRGKIKNNVSLPVLLGQARKELEIDLAKMLFK